MMENQIADSQQDRISVMKTVLESAIGRDLVEATQNLLADQACFFEGVARFEILSARRISTSFRVEISGREGERREVWEFEIFTHSESL
jgi:hypothetical protein